jgi:hypothetical protein
LGFDYSHDAAPSTSECVRAVAEGFVDVYWAVCCSLALSFNFIALFVSTVTAITGPSLALRGPEGSLGVALMHMEQQLQRALRYFGRALVCFALTLTGFGAQAIVALGFLKGLAILIVAVWTIATISYYGADIGTKFHLSIGRAVRAEFSSDCADGALTEDERTARRGARQRAAQEHERTVAKRWNWPCAKKGRRHRLRTPKHARPLWRLDELAILPYHTMQAARGGGRPADRFKARPLPTEQVIGLIGQAQAAALPTIPDGVAEAAHPANEQQLEILDRVALFMQCVGCGRFKPHWWDMATDGSFAWCMPGASATRRRAPSRTRAPTSARGGGRSTCEAAARRRAVIGSPRSTSWSRSWARLCHHRRPPCSSSSVTLVGRSIGGGRRMLGGRF